MGRLEELVESLGGAAGVTAVQRLDSMDRALQGLTDQFDMLESAVAQVSTIAVDKHYDELSLYPRYLLLLLLRSEI